MLYFTMNPLNINKIKKLSQNCDAVNTIKPQVYSKEQKDINFITPSEPGAL